MHTNMYELHFELSTQMSYKYIFSGQCSSTQHKQLY